MPLEILVALIVFLVLLATCVAGYVSATRQAAAVDRARNSRTPTPLHTRVY